MSVIREILDQYLYKEDVQQLARDIGLPVTRDKDEIIEELLINPDFDPVDAVRFLRVWQLQDILRNRGMPSGASRDELFDRVAAMVRKEFAPPKPRRRRTVTAPSTTPDKSAPSPTTGTPSLPSPINIDLHPTLQAPPNRDTERPPAAAWGFVGVVSAGVFTGVFLILAVELGTLFGAIVGLVGCVVVAVTLLMTERRWAPFLGRLVRAESPR